MADHPEFKVNPPECERARSLAQQANQEAEAKNLESAISLIEEAIRLDPIAALNNFHGLREELCTLAGQINPQKSSQMYNHGCQLKKDGRYQDAILAYQEAATLDPLFLWPLNNLAWMLSTSKEKSVRNGPEAVKYALDACEKSNWSCWAFLGTLAAAYAEAGDFERAIGWEKASLELVPEDHRLDSELMLKHFERHHPYVDEGQTPAAGEGSRKKGNFPELLQPKNISIEVLTQIFKEACLATKIDEDNDLWVKDDLEVLVRLGAETIQICFSSFAKPHENANLKDRLVFANRINSSIRLVRASVEKDGMIIFDYTVNLVGGITEKALVFALRYFMGAVKAGKEQCDEDGIFGSSLPGNVQFSEN